MARAGRIKAPKDNKGNLPKPALASTIPSRPSFRFANADTNKYCLHQCTASELRTITEGLTHFGQNTWEQVRTSSGLRYKLVVLGRNDPKPPADLPSDVDLYEFRCSSACRIFGHRVDAVFYLVWFDPQHRVFPE